MILEGGRSEYLAGSLAREVLALAEAAPESLYRRTGAAWVAFTQCVGGAETAEFLVMKQTPDGWRVAAVHWSSAGS